MDCRRDSEAALGLEGEWWIRVVYTPILRHFLYLGLARTYVHRCTQS